VRLVLSPRNAPLGFVFFIFSWLKRVIKIGKKYETRSLNSLERPPTSTWHAFHHNPKQSEFLTHTHRDGSLSSLSGRDLCRSINLILYRSEPAVDMLHEVIEILCESSSNLNGSESSKSSLRAHQISVTLPSTEAKCYVLKCSLEDTNDVVLCSLGGYQFFCEFAIDRSKIQGLFAGLELSLKQRKYVFPLSLNIYHI
jgi:hypothetical protein